MTDDLWYSEKGVCVFNILKGTKNSRIKSKKKKQMNSFHTGKETTCMLEHCRRKLPAIDLSTDLTLDSANKPGKWITYCWYSWEPITSTTVKCETQLIHYPVCLVGFGNNNKQQNRTIKRSDVLKSEENFFHFIPNKIIYFCL